MSFLEKGAFTHKYKMVFGGDEIRAHMISMAPNCP